MNYQDIDKNQYTPMMQQYLDIKKDYVDTIVFFRLGDFYEMFFNDAFVASKVLEIALTGRDAGAKERVPMCGVPYHAANGYIEKLTSRGFKVAIVEQLEEAKSNKTIVKRDVVRLITPGTLIDEGSINDKDNNFLLAVSETKEEYVIAYSDFSIGDNFVTTIPKDFDMLINEIMLLKCKEIIVPSSFKYKNVLEKKYQIVVSIEDNISIPKYLESLVKNLDNNILRDCFGRLLNYLLRTQKRELLHLKIAELYNSKQFLRMDIYTINNLELLSNLRNNTKTGSLLWLLDEAKTALGSREIKKWINRPLIKVEEINNRLDVVEALISNYDVYSNVNEQLKTVYDLERIVGRVSYGNANGRDLLQLKRSLATMPKLKKLIFDLPVNYAKTLSNKIHTLPQLYELLDKSISDDAPLTIKDGGVIKENYNIELDKIKTISKEGRQWLLKYEQQEKERTKIKTLKVGYNRVFGYYIEVSKGALSAINDEFGYERKQTIANAERYITKELKEYEMIIIGSSEKSIQLEYELFCEIRSIVEKEISELQNLARIISQIDALGSLATVSMKYNYVRPLIKESRSINIINGRHPVIEVLIDDVFVKNDIVVNDYNTLLITGPNMSGKSTYMRQLAIMVIMAQIGCFVSAEFATLPIFDQIFTRIGATDDLVRGQSTFMVEMIEANNAIQNATINSLILFDEIGRGTATYDGMALAQAIIEYVHEKIKCTTLFSTHYHELTNLENTLKHLKNIHVTAKEEKGGVIFLHKVQDGKTDKSYGINVAELAHLPKSLILRAKQILTSLEETKGKTEVTLDLFNFDDNKDIEDWSVEEKEILEMLKKVDINNMTPLEALNILYEIKKKI